METDKQAETPHEDTGDDEMPINDAGDSSPESGASSESNGEPDAGSALETESHRDKSDDHFAGQKEQGGAASPERQAANYSIDYDSLEVDLRFEIARRASDLKELSRLSVGSVVKLDKAPESAVAVYANGRQVATAELVLVDGKVGARITARHRD